MTDSKASTPNNTENEGGNDVKNTENSADKLNSASTSGSDESKSKAAATAPASRPKAEAEIVAPASNLIESKPARSGSALSIFAILLSLAALVGSGFTWYQTQIVKVQEESKLSVGVSEIGGQVARLGDSISRVQQEQANIVSQADLKTTALELKALVNEQVQPLKDGQQVLDGALAKINGDLEQGVNKYIIDEVAQLLRLANNNVLFAGDTGSAINALSLADNQLKSLRDPRYTVVRGKINEEIAALRTVKKPDIEGLSGQLRSISELVPSLKLANEPDAQRVSLSEAPVAENLTWRTELKKVWHDMLSSIQVQRVDQPPKPLLVPEQRYFLNQNLQLTLSKAELALLQGKSAMFSASVQEAAGWLREYFDLNDESVGTVVTQLSDIANQTITSEIPAVTQSYQALQNIQGGQL